MPWEKFRNHMQISENFLVTVWWPNTLGKFACRNKTFTDTCWRKVNISPPLFNIYFVTIKTDLSCPHSFSNSISTNLNKKIDLFSLYSKNLYILIVKYFSYVSRIRKWTHLWHLLMHSFVSVKKMRDWKQ